MGEMSIDELVSALLKQRSQSYARIASLEYQLAEARERLKYTTDDCVELINLIGERANREWDTVFHKRVISNREWLKANAVITAGQETAAMVPIASRRKKK